MPAWYDTTWLYRVKLTIAQANISGPSTDFPVFIRLSDCDSHFWAAVQDGGGDIRITTDDGVTECAREVVSCDTATQTGEVHFKAPSIDIDADYSFYLYYGNAAAEDYGSGDTYGQHNVWDSNFTGVWHMGQDPSAGNLYDSTHFGRNLTPLGTRSPSDLVNAVAGKGIDFNGSDEQAYNSAVAIAAGGYTFEALQYIQTTQSGDRFVAGKQARCRLIRSGLTLKHYMYDSADRGPATLASLALTTWQHVSAVFDGSTIYAGVNGFWGSTGYSGSASNFGDFHVAGDSISGLFNDCILDEVRVSGAARSFDWLINTKTNLLTPTGFYALDTHEEVPFMIVTPHFKRLLDPHPDVFEV